MITDRDPEIRKRLDRAAASSSSPQSSSSRARGLTGEDVIATSQMAGGITQVGHAPMAAPVFANTVKKPSPKEKSFDQQIAEASRLHEAEMKELQRKIKENEKEFYEKLSHIEDPYGSPEAKKLGEETKSRQQSLSDEYHKLRRERDQAVQEVRYRAAHVTIEFEHAGGGKTNGGTSKASSAKKSKPATRRKP